MIQNCKRCGRVVLNGTLCPRCSEQTGHAIRQLKEYLVAHPGATLFDITADLDIDSRLVLDLVKAGDITIAENRCRECGRPVDIGALCQHCRNK